MLTPDGPSSAAEPGTARAARCRSGRRRAILMALPIGSGGWPIDVPIIVSLSSRLRGGSEMKAKAKSKTRTKQDVHSFTLIYEGVDDLTDVFCNAISEAGCDDALLGMRNGLVFLDFGREAPSFREALLS